MTNTVTQRKVNARARVARYRATHPMRLDYTPSAAAGKAIAAWLNGNKLGGISGTLDELVVAGSEWLQAKARISGNGR